MSKLKFLRIWLHTVLGLHSFTVFPRWDRPGFYARCNCGVYLKS
jgi:hypothetical protein